MNVTRSETRPRWLRSRWTYGVAAAIVVLAALAGFFYGMDDRRKGPTQASTTLLIDGEDGRTIENLRITTTEGPCIVVLNAKNVTIRDSEIGPCGGHGVEILGSSDVKVVDSYIHPEFPAHGCCDTANGIYAHQSSNLLFQGNVVAYGETNIQLLAVSNAEVTGNFLLNPLGPFPRGTQIQVWSQAGKRSSDILVESNYVFTSKDTTTYTFAGQTTDAINFGHTDRAIVRNNYVTGGRDKAGCGILADDSANSMQFLDNTLVDVGGCGIGIASGTNNIVSGNRIYTHGLDDPQAGNTALYAWKQYPADCGSTQITNNIAVLIRPNGSLSSWWKGSGCDTTAFSGNVFDQAAIEALTPVATKLPVPSIPPRAFANRLVTPFNSSN